MRKNIVIVNAYGHSNRGDSVLLDECINELKVKYDEPDITVVLFDESGYVDRQNITICERIGNVKLNDSRTLATLKKVLIILSAMSISGLKLSFLLKFIPKKQQITLGKMEHADLIISAPGGYIHDTNNAYFIALLHIFIAASFKKKIVLAPQSIGPINGFFGRMIAKNILNSCSMVCVREGYSYQFVKEIGVKEDIIQRAGDSAFWNDFVCNENLESDMRVLGINKGETFLGVTLVNWTFPNLGNPEELMERYIDSVCLLVEFIYEKYGYRTVIFNQVADDIIVADKVLERVGPKVLVDRIDKGPERLRSLISLSKVFVGTRFHSCIFALMAGVPTTAISYLPKTSYILRDLQLGTRSVDITLIDNAALQNKVGSDFDNNSQSRTEIINSVSNYRNNKKRLLDVL
jgi:colanic acid/amylovoran biosynthesis protein